jgi:hypothetical protein
VPAPSTVTVSPTTEFGGGRDRFRGDRPFFPGAGGSGVNLGAANGVTTLSLDDPNRSDRRAVRDAEAAGAFAAELGSSQRFAARNDFTLNTTYAHTDISTNTTFNLTAPGNYVFDVGGVTLTSDPTLTIDGPVGAKVVIDISGPFLVLNGGKIVVEGGILAKNVLIDLTGRSGGTGIVYNGTVEGTILAPHRDVAVLGDSFVQGRVIARRTFVFPPSVVSPEF